VRRPRDRIERIRGVGGASRIIALNIRSKKGVCAGAVGYERDHVRRENGRNLERQPGQKRKGIRFDSFGDEKFGAFGISRFSPRALHEGAGGAPTRDEPRSGSRRLVGSTSGSGLVALLGKPLFHVPTTFAP